MNVQAPLEAVPPATAGDAANVALLVDDDRDGELVVVLNVTCFF